MLVLWAQSARCRLGEDIGHNHIEQVEAFDASEGLDRNDEVASKLSDASNYVIKCDDSEDSNSTDKSSTGASTEVLGNFDASKLSCTARKTFIFWSKGSTTGEKIVKLDKCSYISFQLDKICLIGMTAIPIGNHFCYIHFDNQLEAI